MFKSLLDILKQSDSLSICNLIGGNEDYRLVSCKGVSCAVCPFQDQHNMASFIRQLQGVVDGQQHSN